jgi:3-dehydroquinate synthase
METNLRMTNRRAACIREAHMSAGNLPARKVQVDLGPRSYEVVIGRGLLAHISALLAAHRVGGPFALITDANVFALELTQELLQDAAKTPFHYFGMGGVEDESGLTVAPGERSKSLVEAQFLLSSLAKHKVPRSGAIIALGGGVIGDLAGFAAATYLRGINLVQVPTTLLAMVDSSVGGKTGVNLPEGKNLVGAFHQPRLVVADLDTLRTLPPREFAAGMAEVIKYGCIRDRALFERVVNGVTPEDDDLAEIVEKCVAIKARIVESDEFETKGERALLNFGHTIGHAIEKATGYTRYLHGEAIALGLRAAAWLSVWEAGLPEADARAIEAALLDNDLPLELEADVDQESILAALGNDKKVAADGGNRWVLLKKLGEAGSDYILSPEMARKAIEKLGP